MNQTFKIIWKGQEIANLDSNEVKKQLSLGKIGMQHQVQFGEEILTMKKFLEICDNPEFKTSNYESILNIIAYFFSGIAFLTFYLAIIPLCLAGFFIYKNKIQQAIMIIVLTVLSSLLGVIFFSLIS